MLFVNVFHSGGKAIVWIEDFFLSSIYTSQYVWNVTHFINFHSECSKVPLTTANRSRLVEWGTRQHRALLTVG